MTEDRIPSAWLMATPLETTETRFSLSLAGTPEDFEDIADGDGIVILQENGPIFARIFRVRSEIEYTTLYFDGAVASPTIYTAADFGISATPSGVPIRLSWPNFETTLKTATGLTFAVLPTFAGVEPTEQAYLRELLRLAAVDDLLGPANGPCEEVVGMSVRDRYLVGKLAPLEPAPDSPRIEAGTASSPLDEEESSKEDETAYTQRHEPGEEFESTTGARDPDDAAGADPTGTNNQSLVPSSFGLTFCIDAEVSKVEVMATWGSYVRAESIVDEKSGRRLRVWKRIPSGGNLSIPLNDGPVGPLEIDPAYPDVAIVGTVRKALASGDRLVTLFLVNGQTLPKTNPDVAWMFQPEIAVRAQEGAAVFRKRPVLDASTKDAERIALEMIYRNQVEFAVGHSVAVRATVSETDLERATEVRTIVVPEHEVPVTETPGLEPEDRPAMRAMVDSGHLDMKCLAAMERSDLIPALRQMTDDYAAWIGEQRARIAVELPDYTTVAQQAMDRCETIHNRLEEGISVLALDDTALAAFRFANEAMALQRVRSIFALRNRRGEAPTLAALDLPQNRSWRPFQLAFVLLSIPALADPSHTDRTQPVDAVADLLWFPTGGGKTEAYLGVAAFTMAMRRLKSDLGGYDASRGLAVVMRYTLRLLTLQQFQRATALICAMETIRRADLDKWGSEPFSIGLWVGSKVTPNKTEDSHEAILKERDDKSGKLGSGATPAQLTFCPWCGSEILSGRDIFVDRERTRTIIYCGDKLGACEFTRARAKDEGLPVRVVDEEIYRRPPTMLVATVDKFAMMAWEEGTRTLFGIVSEECPRHGLIWPDGPCNGNHTAKGAIPATKMKSVTPLRPPDLIIQDEFHLISGPLGTMVGLYETAVDELATWNLDGKAIRPKVVASTATVRKAEEQVRHVFLREVAVFPPHGLDVADNFFACQRPIEQKPGRRYLGICAPGSSRPAVLIRVYVALLTGAQTLFDRFGPAADPYMTLVGYFNSLRELGGMKRLAEDDVQTRAFRVAMSQVRRPGLSQRKVTNVEELTSRVSSKDIPKKLDLLEVKFKKTWAKGEAQAVDIVLATNMLSVGVDINRIGLMVTNGQPKSTAEYIQATSRVGRAFPGLVCTVLTWSRPRDLSHYETFEHYHATFYKHVEAQSVTPFAPRALDRGLTGTAISMVRLAGSDLAPNLGAERMNSATRPEVKATRLSVGNRAWSATNDKSIGKHAADMVSSRFDLWIKEATRGGRKLGYERQKGDGTVVPFLKRPGVKPWDETTVPMSLREVESDVRLVMDDDKKAPGPAWSAPPKRSAGGSDKEAGS